MNHLLVAECKRELIQIYRHALDAIKPDLLVRNAVSFRGSDLIIHDANKGISEPLVYQLDKKRIHVIGGGKCALAMAKGLAEVANQKRSTNLFSHGCLSVPVISRPEYMKDANLQTLLKSIDLDCKFGSLNNLPDENSVAGTRFMMERVADACRSDRSKELSSLFIVLISGGGSACLSSPKHISLEQKSSIIKQLVQRGADIVELNKVRRCFSHVKGGNLARHIMSCSPDAQVVSLIMSDVIDDPVEFIASGPTYVEDQVESLESSMVAVMKKYDLNIPDLVQCTSVPTPPGRLNRSVINRVIGNNMIALRAAKDKAETLNYRVKLLANNLIGDTADVVEEILFACEGHVKGKLLLLAGGEATVRRREGESWGLGGRTQETALDYMIAQLVRSRDHPLREDDPVDVLLAGSTDGQDGPTDVAGCLASFAEWSANETFTLEEALEVKRLHDSFNFWSEREPEWLLKLGSTGTNVMDLYLLAFVSKSQ